MAANNANNNVNYISAQAFQVSGGTWSIDDTNSTLDLRLDNGTGGTGGIGDISPLRKLEINACSDDEIGQCLAREWQGQMSFSMEELFDILTQLEVSEERWFAIYNRFLFEFWLAGWKHKHGKTV